MRPLRVLKLRRKGRWRAVGGGRSVEDPVKDTAENTVENTAEDIEEATASVSVVKVVNSQDEIQCTPVRPHLRHAGTCGTNPQVWTGPESHKLRVFIR